MSLYYVFAVWLFFLFFKQKTAYEMRISDWSSDVCSSDLRKCIVRLIQRLSAQKIPVAIIGVPHLRAARVDKVIKTIALHINAVQADCQILRYRTSYTP